eukprot:7201263-Karenia_brevis.AAC.1
MRAKVAAETKAAIAETNERWNQNMMNFIQSQQEGAKAQQVAIQNQTNQVTALIARIESSSRDRAISADRSRRHKHHASSRK